MFLSVYIKNVLQRNNLKLDFGIFQSDLFRFFHSFVPEEFAEKLGLVFTEHTVPGNSKSFPTNYENASPVCYAQSDEIRKEFYAESTPKTFAPIDILDYIYAVLHSPTYREKYKEFLKIDFPRVPYPKDAATFWKLVKLGGEIRQIHLLESPKVEQYITSFPKDGSNTVTRSIGKKDWEIIGENTNNGVDPANQLGRIWINDEQYFDKIALAAWEFYIGGYQPAQKWLKDRKGRELSFEDILRYQKIIVTLSETDRLMKEIGKVGV